MLEDNDCEIFSGYIYIIFNEMYLFYGENYKKIGKTKCIDNRMCGYTTSYIKPLEILYSSELCKNCTLAEKVIFQKLKDYRVVNNREFFNVELKIAVNIIKSVISDINNDIIVEYIIDKKILCSIINVKDITEKEYHNYNNLKNIISYEYERIIEKHMLKILYGVDKLNEEIIKISKSQIENFIMLIDVENINNNDKNLKEKYIAVMDLLNNIGYEHIYSKKIIEKKELENNLKNIIKKSIIFNDDECLFERITNNKKFLGYVNTVLFNYSIKISSFSHRLRKINKNEKNELTEENIKEHNEKCEKLIISYKIERLMGIDEIIDNKIIKGFKLKDSNNIRNYEKTDIYSNLIIEI